MSMEGLYVATVGVITVFQNAKSLALRRCHAFASGEGRALVATMSMEGRYAATVGVITVFQNAKSLALRRCHAFASGEGRKLVAAISMEERTFYHQWSDQFSKCIFSCLFQSFYSNYLPALVA